MGKTIPRKIHIYSVKVKSPRSLDIDEIYNKFVQKNIQHNIREFDNNQYLLVSFKKEGDLLGGTFCKSRDLSPLIFKKKSSILQWFSFGEDEELGEPSLLIWDIKHNIILSEMNWAGARYISTHIGKYLSEILNLEITVQPIIHAEAYKQMFLRSRTIKKLILEVPKPNINLIKDAMGADIKDIKKYTEDDEDMAISVTISCTKWRKGILLDKINETFNKLKKFKGKESIKFFAVDSKQEVLPLLDDALVKEPMTFEIDTETKSINKENFFDTVKRFWESNRGDILRLLN